MPDQKEAVRRAYDEMGEVYAAERASEIGLLDELTDRISGEARILDAGCGQGEPITACLSGQFDVVGVDFSRGQLRLARKTAPEAALVQGDMASLGFAANVFDGICAYYSIIHVPTKEHRTVFEEFARVLRSDGALLITVGDDAWKGSNPNWLESGVKMQWSFPELERTRQYLSDAGFEVVNQWTAEDNLGGGDDNDDGGFPFLLVRLT